MRLEEDPDLQLPFLLPEDGYSCEVVQSVPSGLTEFARPLVAESNNCNYLNSLPGFSLQHGVFRHMRVSH